MSQSYAETRDAQGRETLELHDDMPVLLPVCCALSVVPLFFFGWEAILFVIANVLVFGSLSTWFLFARRRMRVTIDPAARTLSLESGRRARVLAFGEVLRAQPAAAGGPGSSRYRVELALASGEVVPLYAGLGGFHAEHCQRLADRLNSFIKT